MKRTLMGAAVSLACAFAIPTLAQNVKITRVTEGGKLRPPSRAAALVKALKGPIPYLAISGRTMEFDGKGKCVAGC